MVDRNPICSLRDAKPVGLNAVLERDRAGHSGSACRHLGRGWLEVIHRLSPIVRPAIGLALDCVFSGSSSAFALKVRAAFRWAPRCSSTVAIAEYLRRPLLARAPDHGPESQTSEAGVERTRLVVLAEMFRIV